MALSAPAKLILFGEWAVTRGHPGLATALDRRFRVNYTRSDANLRIRTSNDDAEPLASDSAEIPPYWRLPLGAWKHFGLPSQGDALFTRDWKLEEGLGSSSALISCLAGLAASLCRGPFTKPTPLTHSEAIWREARHAIRQLQSPRASGLDAAAQIWGASVVLRGDDIEALFLEKPPELVLIHTSRKLDTARALAGGSPAEDVLSEIGSSCDRFLETRDWERAIAEHSVLLQSAGCVPPFVQEAAQAWKAAGLVKALKTTGAGGGDGLLAWSPIDKHAALAQEVARIGGWLSEAGWNAEGLKEELA